jgi:hypothetical protein
MTEAVSADTAIISTMMRGNAPGTGSSSITVQGMGFGLVGYTTKIRDGSTGCEATGWQSETSVRCYGASGTRGTRRVTMTTGGKSGSTTEAWSVDESGVSASRRSNYAGTGSVSLTVHGAGLGLFGFSGKVRTSGSSCSSTVWESETNLKCLSSSGTGKSQSMSVTVGVDIQG